MQDVDVYVCTSSSMGNVDKDCFLFEEKAE